MDEQHPDAVPDQRERVRPRKDKEIALEDINFVSEDLLLPGWNLGFTPGDGSGTSEAPLPDDSFANLPPGFTTPASLDEASRREVVAEGSRECGSLIQRLTEVSERRVFRTSRPKRSRGNSSVFRTRLRKESADRLSPIPELSFVRRGKGGGGWNPGFTPGDGSGTSEAPLPNDFFANLPPGFTTPASLDEASRREVVAEGSRLINEGMRVFNSTLDGSFREARLSHFKAEEIERKFIGFPNEVAVESFKDAQDYVGDFCECRGSVGRVDGSSNRGENLRALGTHRGFGGHDGTGADAADEGGEVDEPADSFGALISGYLDLDL
ncbi:hypothetical protein DY000_02015129 [Brassica cretica]|uniref:Uncharacterized protein n=1 Tax=Brassica cretica TaxID=69181 RepID=A0ABQ7CV51_BRACR|nr:hypothetical protein DY000_02015129 [Brassica cretica]